MGCGKSKPSDQVVEQPRAAPAAKPKTAANPAPASAPPKPAGAAGPSGTSAHAPRGPATNSAPEHKPAPAAKAAAAPAPANHTGYGSAPAPATAKPAPTAATPAAAAPRVAPPASGSAAAVQTKHAAAVDAPAAPAPGPAGVPAVPVSPEPATTGNPTHEPAPTAASTPKHEPASAVTHEAKQESALVAPGDSARVPAAALAPQPGHAAPAAAASEAGQAHAPANATVAAAGGPDVARAEQEARSLAGVRVVFVLGGPGSGKGTQCAKMVDKYGYVHLSAGDLLREEVARGSELGRDLETAMKEGKLVPSGVTVRLLRAAMLRSGSAKFLIDGFPRAIDQAQIFEEEIVRPKLVLFFDCPEDVMVERLLERGKTSGRSDDNEATIRKRFDTFHKASMPVAEHYEAQGLCARISAVPPPDDVFTEVCRAMDALDAGGAGAGAVAHAQEVLQHAAAPAAHAAERAPFEALAA